MGTEERRVEIHELSTLMDRFRARLQSEGWGKIRVDEWRAPEPQWDRSIRFNYAHREQRMHLLRNRYPHGLVVLNLDQMVDGLPSVHDLLERVNATFEQPANPNSLPPMKLGDPCPACGRPVESLTADSATPSDKLLVKPCGHLYDLITKQVGG
jgi:hypothetical protein